MIIRRLHGAELVTYDLFAHSHGTLFNCLDGLALFGDKIHVAGIFDEGGKMLGGLSFYQEHRWGLKILRSAPFTPSCGPFFDVKARNPVAILETRRKVMECVIEYIEKQAAAVVMLPLDQRINDALVFFWNDYKIIPYYTYRLCLSASLEHILKQMTPIRRNDIRKGLRDSLIVRQTSDMALVLNFVLATFQRQEKFINRVCLESILFQYANSSNSFAFTTFRDDIPLATCFVVHDSTTAYYLLGGYNVQDRHHGAGPLAVFEAIKYSKEIGLKIFDFEGSVIPAIERYFRGFGGELTPYFTVNKALLPLEIAFKFVKRGVF